jgi:hypothetical protein
MGVNFHITRAEFWAENSDNQISSEEWLDLIKKDPELNLDQKNGEYHTIWNGEASDGEAWLDWFEGNVMTKWPDTALYRKMLQISQKLNAKVMDDEGTLYETPDAWQYEPKTIITPSAFANSLNGSKVAAERNAIQRFLALFGFKRS